MLFLAVIALRNIFVKKFIISLEEVKLLDNTERGVGGFGSTGKT